MCSSTVFQSYELSDWHLGWCVSFVITYKYRYWKGLKPEVFISILDLVVIRKSNNIYKKIYFKQDILGFLSA